MGIETKISWAHHTASPWYGCSEVSAGCSNCYAREWGKKLGIEWGNGKPRMRSKSFNSNVRKWNRHAGTFYDWDEQTCSKAPFRTRIFPSLCDWLDPEVPIEWLADFLRVIHDTPHLTWLLLTKRPELYFDRTRAAIATCSGWTKAEAESAIYCPDNCWIGVTCENQKAADERIPLLLRIPAKVRWISAEPLLEPINFEMALEGFQPLNLDLSRKPSPVQWIIVGGESGPKRRDCGVDAIIDVARQCQGAGVPVWVKQASALKPGRQESIPDEY